MTTDGAQPQKSGSARAGGGSKRVADKSPGVGAGAGGGGYPESVVRLIEELARLPGIGRRSAERLAFHVLKTKDQDILPLARAIKDVKERVRHCRVCFNLCDQPGVGASIQPASLCPVCADDRRDRSVVMVVEQPKDLIALEQTGSFKGIYHILMGRISPLDGVGPGDVTLAELVGRVRDPRVNAGGVAVSEVVLALNPTLEGDGTGLHVAAALAELTSGAGGGVGGVGGGAIGPVRITRLARGVPTGSYLEYASRAVLADAIEGRKPV